MGADRRPGVHARNPDKADAIDACYKGAKFFKADHFKKKKS